MERKSWAVKGESLLEELVGLIGISDEETNALAQAEPQAQAVASQLADAF